MVFWFNFFVKNIFFFLVFIFQWIRYSNVCSLFFGWEIGHPLSTFTTEGMEGVIQNVYKCIQGERGITPQVYLRTYRHLLFSCFCLRCLVFNFIKKGVLLYIFESPQKQAFNFLKRISYANVCLKLLCDAKLVMSLLIL